MAVQQGKYRCVVKRKSSVMKICVHVNPSIFMQRFLAYGFAIMRHYWALVGTIVGSTIVGLLGWLPTFLNPTELNNTIFPFYSRNSWYIALAVFLCGFFYASFLAWNEEFENLNQKKLEILRLEAEKAALEDRPEVIFSGKTQGPLITWELINKKATAFNIKSDAIRCGQLSAVLKPISQLEPGEKITPIFLIVDERYERHRKQQAGDPSPYLQIILDDNKHPAAHILTLHYINASGQHFRSETDIFWDSEQNRVETAHKQITAVLVRS